MARTQIPDWDTEFRQLSQGVYAFVQADGGWSISDAGLIVGDDSCIVVDALNTIAVAQEFKSAIKKATSSPVQFLINTHHHSDHTNGNQEFSESPIIAHYKAREEMLAMPPPVVNPDNIGTPIDNTGVVPTPPNFLISAQTEIYQGDRRIQLIPCAPAHTNNDVLVYLPDEGILFGGDVVFFYSTPMCGGGNFQNWMAVADEIARMDVETIVPGHGPIGGKAELAEMREYMGLLHYETRKRYDAGMSRSEATRDIDLGAFKSWRAPERIFRNVAHLWSEFGGEPFDDEATQEMLEIMQREREAAKAG